MSLKHMLIIPLLATISCSQDLKKDYASYADYPVLTDDWIEMDYTPVQTQFSLWAPTADEVQVVIYAQAQGGTPQQMIRLLPAPNGMWKAVADGDYKGLYYVFNVKIDGVWQGDTPGVMAKAVGVNGDRAAIIDLRSTDPEGWESDRRPPLKSFSDIILYEMHHREFSIDTAAHIKNRCKFLALTEQHTCMLDGTKTGLDHLKELGVTHVHLLPSFDFSSVDESIVPSTYNWGYDPKNFNVPEGSYATDPFKPGVRIKEFKEMVMALHQAGIRVVMDVVYNHTAVLKGSVFERTVPGYFYRKDEKGNWGNASGCGNETASEREMVRKFIVESVSYWAKEYHVDGFRFDLMGVHDIATMNAVRKALDAIDPTIFVYGEGWAANPPLLETRKLAMKTNIKQMPRIAAFSDEFRDSLRGEWGDDSKGAFVIGRKGFAEGIRMGVVGGVEHPQLVSDSLEKKLEFWTPEPTQFISYVSCHDDLCLQDRLKSSYRGASEKELVTLEKFAQSIVLTSQGVPFIYSGDEMMRTKKGVSNSYRSPDNVNAIFWKKKAQYRELFDYVKELIAMRKAHPAFRLGTAEQIGSNIQFLKTDDSNVVAYQIAGNIMGERWKNIIVVYNARRDVSTVNIPEGVYTVACGDGLIDWRKGMGTVKGNVVNVAPRSTLILHQ